jgi:hypothetical protein
MSRAITASAILLRGDPTQAWEALDGIGRKAEEQPNHMRGIVLIGNIVAEVSVRSGHYAELERFCGWMLPYLESEGLQRFAGELLYWCGRRLAAQGDHADALDALKQSRTILERIGVPVLLWQVDTALAGSLIATGDHAGAASARERCVANIQQLAAGIDDPALRASFLARAEVQEALHAPA